MNRYLFPSVCSLGIVALLGLNMIYPTLAQDRIVVENQQGDFKLLENHPVLLARYEKEQNPSQQKKFFQIPFHYVNGKSTLYPSSVFSPYYRHAFAFEEMKSFQMGVRPDLSNYQSLKLGGRVEFVYRTSYFNQATNSLDYILIDQANQTWKSYSSDLPKNFGQFYVYAYSQKGQEVTLYLDKYSKEHTEKQHLFSVKIDLETGQVKKSAPSSLTTTGDVRLISLVTASKAPQWVPVAMWDENNKIKDLTLYHADDFQKKVNLNLSDFSEKKREEAYQNCLVIGENIYTALLKPEARPKDSSEAFWKYYRYDFDQEKFVPILEEEGPIYYGKVVAGKLYTFHKKSEGKFQLKCYDLETGKVLAQEDYLLPVKEGMGVQVKM